MMASIRSSSDHESLVLGLDYCVVGWNKERASHWLDSSD